MIRTIALLTWLPFRLLAVLGLGLGLFAGPSHSQTITLPESLEAKTGRLATITIKHDCKDLKWTIVPSDNIDQFREFEPDPALVRLRFMPYQDGAYYLVVAGALGDKETIKTCVITAKGAPPPIPPVPPPAPPGPTPGPEPGPGRTADFIIGITDNINRDMKVASILEDHALAKWLDDRKIKWRVIDVGQKAYSEYKLDLILVAQNVRPPAIITYAAGKLLHAAPAPASSDAVKAFVEGKRQSTPKGARIAT